MKRQTIRTNEIKRQLGCCICKESCPECLEFHHIDKNTKKEKRKYLSGLTGKQMILELQKCICVCANCHSKIHRNIIVLTDEQKQNFRVKLDENQYKELIADRRKITKYDRIQEMIDNKEVIYIENAKCININI